MRVRACETPPPTAAMSLAAAVSLERASTCPWRLLEDRVRFAYLPRPAGIGERHSRLVAPSSIVTCIMTDPMADWKSPPVCPGKEMLAPWRSPTGDCRAGTDHDGRSAAPG